MSYDSQDASEFGYSVHEYLPPVSRAQLEQSLEAALVRLPHTVEILPEGDAVIYLSSGRAVRVTLRILGGDDSSHLDVAVHEIDGEDVPEMMLIYGSVVENTIFAARMLWARQQAMA